MSRLKKIRGSYTGLFIVLLAAWIALMTIPYAAQWLHSPSEDTKQEDIQYFVLDTKERTLSAGPAGHLRNLTSEGGCEQAPSGDWLCETSTEILRGRVCKALPKTEE